MQEIAELDGCYVLKSNLATEAAGKYLIHDRYKALAMVESTTYWAANLNIWTEMIRQELSDNTHEAIYPFYDWLIINIPIFVKLSDEPLSGFSEERVPGH